MTYLFSFDPTRTKAPRIQEFCLFYILNTTIISDTEQDLNKYVLNE